jgi:hypothetical protein
VIRCPNCNNPEYPGAIFCNKCGAEIGTSDNWTTARSKIPENPVSSKDIPPPPIFPPQDIRIDSGVALHILHTGDVIKMNEHNEYILGRATQQQPLVPDIDLTPYNAYDEGISRLHLSIKIEFPELFVQDLGSVNGTLINDKRMTPHVDYPINHGDILTLGKLKIQLITQE